MATLGRAIAIAAQAHQDQVDKAGKPYILHPIRVMMQMDSETEMVAAILHDVVEDSEWTIEALREEGFSEEVLQAVAAVTRQADETYEAFTDRAGQNPLGRKVKLADLEDNMDLRRLGQLGQQEHQRLERYHRAWRRLR